MPSGYTRASHFAEALAASGLVTIHLGHRESAPGARQVSDRPADVSLVLDLLADDALELPDGFEGAVEWY